MAVHDGDGIRTTVFFKGCPLKCVWCHNPEGISFNTQLAFYKEKCISCTACAKACRYGAIKMGEKHPIIDNSLCTGCGDCSEKCPADAIKLYGEDWTVEALAEELLRDKPFFDSSGGGVTLSGGESLAQPEFAIALAKNLFLKGVSVDIDTCGLASRDTLEKIAPYVDTFLYDIKAINRDVHIRCTANDNAVIIENLKYLCESGQKIEVRYPYVKGYNSDECEAIGRFLSTLSGISGVKVLKYHSFADSKYEALGMEDTLPDVTVTDDDISEAVNILKSFGLNAFSDN